MEKSTPSSPGSLDFQGVQSFPSFPRFPGYIMKFFFYKILLIFNNKFFFEEFFFRGKDGKNGKSLAKSGLDAYYIIIFCMEKMEKMENTSAPL
jgi:hypothetical protein